MQRYGTPPAAHTLLGDLATVVALAGVLRPAALMDALGPYRYAFLLSTAAAVAASTKISLVPLSLIASALDYWPGHSGKNRRAKSFERVRTRASSMDRSSFAADDLDLHCVRIVLGPGPRERVRPQRVST